jgi:hypothetical protein
MQAASDVFLGWTEDVASHRHFYVRHLKNRRLGSIGELVEERALASYARLCGRTLARAHARAADPAVLAGYMGKRDVLDDALASFAMAYAARTQNDYEQLVATHRTTGNGTDLPTFAPQRFRLLFGVLRTRHLRAVHACS